MYKVYIVYYIVLLLLYGIYFLGTRIEAKRYKAVDVGISQYCETGVITPGAHVQCLTEVTVVFILGNTKITRHFYNKDKSLSIKDIKCVYVKNEDEDTARLTLPKVSNTVITSGILVPVIVNALYLLGKLFILAAEQGQLL